MTASFQGGMIRIRPANRRNRREFKCLKCLKFEVPKINPNVARDAGNWKAVFEKKYRSPGFCIMPLLLFFAASYRGFCGDVLSHMVVMATPHIS